MFGDLIRGAMVGRKAGKAALIMIDTLCRPLEEYEIDALKWRASLVMYSNEFELALSGMKFDSSNKLSPADPVIRMRVLAFYDKCISRGLILDEQLKDQFNKIKLNTDQVDSTHQQFVEEIIEPNNVKASAPTPAALNYSNAISSKGSKKWKHSNGGLINTLTNEFIPESSSVPTFVRQELVS